MEIIKKTFLRNNKRLNEEEVKSSLVTLIPETITQDKFNKSIYLLVKELYHFDNTKYAIIMHIAEKAKNQIDKEIFYFHYVDLQNELRLWI